MDQLVSTIIASAVPTLAVIAAFVRNESAISGLSSRIDHCNKRIETLTRDMNSRFERIDARFETLTNDMNMRFERVDARFETLTRDMNARFENVTHRVDSVNTDLREWARISMQHNTDIARLKDKAGLTDPK